MPAMVCHESPAPSPTIRPSSSEPETLIRCVDQGSDAETRGRTQESTQEPRPGSEPTRQGHPQRGHRARPRSERDASEGCRESGDHAADGVREAQGDVIAAQQRVGLDRERAVGREAAEESGAEQQARRSALRRVQHRGEQRAEGERPDDIDDERGEREQPVVGHTSLTP